MTKCLINKPSIADIFGAAQAEHEIKTKEALAGKGRWRDLDMAVDNHTRRKFFKEFPQEEIKWAKNYNYSWHGPELKILVIDDYELHRESAKLQFDGRSVIIVDTYNEAWELIEYQKWDVVLTDLVMPAGDREQLPNSELVGMKIPAGWSLALNAVATGVPFVGCLSEGSHHDSPASAMLDMINGRKFIMDNSKVIFSGHEYPVRIIDEYYGRVASAKNWGALLSKLINDES